MRRSDHETSDMRSLKQLTFNLGESSTSESLCRIVSGNFVAGLVLRDVRGVETVIETVPIVKYMKHWSKIQVERYCSNRGWTMETVVIDY